MNKLYDGIDYNNLKFQYVGPSKDIRFYEYKDSKEPFDAIKNNKIKFSEVKNKQNYFLNKLSNTKLVKKLSNKKKRIITLKNFTVLEKQLLIFFYLMLITMQNIVELRENSLRY